MSSHLSQTINNNSKTLNTFAVSLSSEPLPEYLESAISDVFNKLSAVMQDSNQVLYIRDIKLLAIDGIYPGGHCYNRHEAMIAVPSWNVDKVQVIASIAHELHHMARWQNVGYGKTLGGAILSEGLATYYEKVISGWTPPWSKTDIDESMLLSAKKEWDNSSYDHGDWFFKGKLGRWVGYSIGYSIAKEMYKNAFSLENSVKVQPKDVNTILDELLMSTKD